MRKHPAMPSSDAENAVFSIDVEDWYHGIELPPEQWTGKEDRIERGVTAVLDLLRESGTKGTFFVLGWVAERHGNLIKTIAAEGHELASHGYSHRKVYDMSPEEFRGEVRKTKEILERLTGIGVTAHRSPFFSITRSALWALKILKDEGYSVDCSISPVKTWRYGIEGSPTYPYRIRDLGLLEFPVSTFRILTKSVGLGGAYFRILPFAMTAAGIRRSLGAQGAAMFYAHPWEYDPDHPRLDEIEARARLTHYFNLRSTLTKTARLLRSFRFRTLKEVQASLEASGTVPDVELTALAR